MEPKTKAILLDAILRKFEGDKTFGWDEMHDKSWYGQFHDDFFVVENLIRYLVADNALRRTPSLRDDKYSLSDKGFAMLGDVEHDSYLSRYNKDVEQKNYNKKILYWAIAATLLTALSIIISLLI